MKTPLSILAVIVAVVGFVNFFVATGGTTPIPLFVSHPLAMLAMAYLLFQVIFPRTVYQNTPPPSAEAIQRLRASGGELARGLVGGRIGWLSFRGPLIGVTVFPGGILLRPILMPAAAIFREEIQAIREQTVFLSTMTEITHTSPYLRTPIQLTISRESTLGRALFMLQL